MKGKFRSAMSIIGQDVNEVIIYSDNKTYDVMSLYPVIMEPMKQEIIDEQQRIFEESMVNRNVVSCMSRKSSSI